ncbi:MAG: hypothetical protein H0T42_22020 [Deltaproteobacteria bacterium]|nr:hypothetical protein [Deltaproteobacteria bacterium]
MRLAVAALVGCLLAACGGGARQTEPLHEASGDDRILIASVELRGVSEPERPAVTAIAGTHLVVDEVLTEARYDSAHKAILDHYYERGHVNVQVTWPETLEHAKGKTPIVVTIDEGPLFTVTKLDIKDVPDADRARYIALSTLRPGDTFVRSQLGAWLQAVAEAAPRRPIVVPETTVDLQANTISITLALKNP